MAAWRAEVAEVQAAILRIEKPVRDRIAPGLPMGALDDAVAAYNTPESERTPAEVATVYGLLSRDGRIRPADWPRLLDPAAASRRQDLLAELDRATKAAPRPLPTARGIDEAGPDAPPTYFLRRGELAAPRAGRRARGPGRAGDRGGRPVRRSRRAAGSSGRRRALADWLTRPDHPLTARVMVNRLWQDHFGRGLVGTSSDFGTMGDEPSHPELLDWLAAELVARGWSLKAMHRLIVTSATYRQSSRPRSPAEREADPENRWLSGQNRRRLDGEAIRDALLAASGRLNPALGGPGVFPPLPPELTKLSSKGAIWPVSAAGRGPGPPEPVRLRPAQPALSVLRGLRPARHERELPEAARHHDRAAGAQPAQQPALFRRGPCPGRAGRARGRPGHRCEGRARLPPDARPPARCEEKAARPATSCPVPAAARSPTSAWP